MIIAIGKKPAKEASCNCVREAFFCMRRGVSRSTAAWSFTGDDTVDLASLLAARCEVLCEWQVVSLGLDAGSAAAVVDAVEVAKLRKSDEAEPKCFPQQSQPRRRWPRVLPSSALQRSRFGPGSRKFWFGSAIVDPTASAIKLRICGRPLMRPKQPQSYL